MTPLQRRLESSLRNSASTLLSGRVTESAWECAKLPTCHGGLGIRVAQLGFTAQAAFWSAVDSHLAVMPRTREALGRPIGCDHPDSTLAEMAQADSLTAGADVDLHANVQFEHEAKAAYAERPWVNDKAAEEVIRPTLVQTDELVQPRSLAREAACATLLSRVLSTAEAAQVARLHQELSPEQQTTMPSAGGPGTGTSWTAMHQSPTDRMHSGGR